MLFRSQLNVTTIVFNNQSYAILNVELQRVGATAAVPGAEQGAKARSQLDLSRPGLDFVQMAQGMGVNAMRVSTTEALVSALSQCLRSPGPHLIEAVVPSNFQGLKLKLLPHVLNSLAHLPAPIARALKRKVSP